MVLVTVTDYTTVTPTPTLRTLQTTATILNTYLSTLTTHIMSPVLHSNTPTTLPTTNATLPLGFNPPSNPPSKPNNTIIILLLVLVIILATLFCCLMGYVIYLRCKGQCFNCLGLKEQIRKWQNGELKRVTKEMVRRREAVNGKFEEVDLETGPRVHAETLKKLEGTHKSPFWKTFGWKTRSKKAEMTEVQPTQPKNVISDRVFLAVDSPSILGPSTSSHASSSKHSDFGNGIHPVYRSASSTYSQPAIIDEGPWSFKEYPTANTSPIGGLKHPIPQARPRALFVGGDLGNPYAFEDTDEEGEHEKETQSTVSQYKLPEWRLNKRFSDRGRGKRREGSRSRRFIVDKTTHE